MKKPMSERKRGRLTLREELRAVRIAERLSDARELPVEAVHEAAVSHIRHIQVIDLILE